MVSEPRKAAHQPVWPPRTEPGYVLYGMPASLYTAKARSALRKARIPFEERSPSHGDFATKIIPAIGRWIIPVLVTPSGEILQDGADILDHLENLPQNPLCLTPNDPVLASISAIFELFGGEGLLRAAMHYRWNFDADNLDFVRADFSAALAHGGTRSGDNVVFETASRRMRQAAMAFGVTPETHALVEQSFIEFLGLFDAHLAHSPYLLGPAPTRGDMGLIAPLFAHLGRDPHPASLMKRVAPRVWRYVERMNAPDADASDYPETVLADAPIRDSLKALLRFIARDYLPEIEAHYRFTNEWLEARSDDLTGINGLSKPGERTIGFAPMLWRGQKVHIAILPYRLYLLQRIQDHFAHCAASDQAAILHLLRETGLEPILHLRTHRRIERVAHLEVWGYDQRRA